MRRLILMLACCCMSTPAAGAVVIFWEGMVDGASGGQTFATTAWTSSPPLSYSGSGDTRTTSPRTHGVDGNDGRNVFLSGGEDWILSGIDTRGYLPGSFQLAFAARKEAIVDDMQNLLVEFSVDGWDYSPLLADGLPRQPTGTGTTGWRDIQLDGLSLPATDQLHLRFTNRPIAGGGAYRLDNVQLSANAVPEPGAMAALSVAAVAGAIARRRRNQLQKCHDS